MKYTSCLLIITALSACLLGACTSGGSSSSSSLPDGGTPAAGDSSAVSVSQSVTVPDETEIFTNKDYYTDYEPSECTLITLDGDNSYCDSVDLSIDGQTVTIMDEGNFILSGSLDDGMVIIDAGDNDKIRLILDNADISSSSSAAIYVRNADKVFITLAEGSENSLSSPGEFISIDDNDIDAAVFSKCDLTFNGSGALNVISSCGHGIVCKKDLVVTGGDFVIDSASHGLSGKKSIAIAGGSFGITSGKDGIHSEHDDADKGYIYIKDGDFRIVSDGDAVSASSDLTVVGGNFGIVSGGGSENAEMPGAGNQPGGMPGGRMFGGGRGDGMMRGTFNEEMSPEGASPPDDMPRDPAPQGNPPEGAETPEDMPEGTAAESVMARGGMPDMPEMNEGINPSDEMPPGMRRGGPGMPEGSGPSEISDAPGETGDNPEGMPGFPTEGSLSGGERMMPPSFTEGTPADKTEETSSVSSKGLKSDSGIVIKGGTFSIDSSDDSIHGLTVFIESGSFELKSGDEAIHADQSIDILSGSVSVSYAYEGVKANIINIYGGEIGISAVDDALNASVQSDSMAVSINISGGDIELSTTVGDGIDSNGDLSISGGSILIFSSESAAEVPIDYDGTAVLSGGTLLAAGSKGMLQSLPSETQGVICVAFDDYQNGVVRLLDQDGSTLIRFEPDKNYNAVLLSSALIENGGEYLLMTGDNETPVTMDGFAFTYGTSYGRVNPGR